LDAHDTFEAYCKDRWHFSDRYARDLIAAEKVRVKIGSMLPVENLNDRQLLEISKVPEKKMAQVAAQVIEQCESENRLPTAKDFKAAAKPFIEPKQEVEYENVEDDPPEREPVKDDELPPEDFEKAIANLRAIIKSHTAAMTLAVDDLHRYQPCQTSHNKMHSSFRVIDAVMAGWK
jgi:hypothetical protein